MTLLFFPSIQECDNLVVDLSVRVNSPNKVQMRELLSEIRVNERNKEKEEGSKAGKWNKSEAKEAYGNLILVEESVVEVRNEQLDIGGIGKSVMSTVVQRNRSLKQRERKEDGNPHTFTHTDIHTTNGM